MSTEERIKSYQKEKSSWITNQALVGMSTDAVTHGSNIIRSHVVYSRKRDGSAKAIIVSWSHRDADKNDVRGDGSSLNLNAMRLILSLTAEKS